MVFFVLREDNPALVQYSILLYCHHLPTVPYVASLRQKSGTEYYRVTSL